MKGRDDDFRQNRGLELKMLDKIHLNVQIKNLYLFPVINHIEKKETLNKKENKN